MAAWHPVCLSRGARPALASPVLPRRRARALHATVIQPATAIPKIIGVGPPPEPPIPASAKYDDRFARKRKQLELLQQGQSTRPNPARPASALQRRFWRDVSVQETADGLQILLDARPVRTAAKNVLTIPREKAQLAAAIALEWDLLVSSQQALKQHYIPLTSLTNRALEIEVADEQGNGKARDDLIRNILRYLDTDTLLCWAPETNIHDPAEKDRSGGLRNKQMQVAQPIISFLAQHVWPGVDIKPILGTDSIIPEKQPQMTTEVIRGWISGLPAWELAGLERGVLASKSVLIAARLLVQWSSAFSDIQNAIAGQPTFGIDEAAEASSVEVRWQTGMWGEVEDTHDVEREDLRRQLGSVILLVHST
ncbi:MAG: ATP synthase complex assembly protein atp12 [Bathelium mastoideum]|nr:MAG: ATP synthase complex assembly protein atp12 [Bathelium mastoideum]